LLPVIILHPSAFIPYFSMNFPIVWKMLAIVATLIGGMMVFSLPWAAPALGHAETFEWNGFIGLLGAIVICFVTAALLKRMSRGAKIEQLYRKEAMASVGLSWVLATVLGALPFLFSGTYRQAADPEKGIAAEKMNIADALFESQSGFSTTGATVITDLESPQYVPRCILFWRSSTHFLGGLGIIVLFVAILGQGSAGKALMRAEMPGPTQDSAQARMQHTSWVFAAIYCALNLVLTILLKLMGMRWFDAICHAFGTMATGGFSTYNKSLGHFAASGDYPHALGIEMTVLVFMVLAGTNFTLLYYLIWVHAGRWQPLKIFGDVEWKTYMSVIVGVTALIVLFGHFHHSDFGNDLGSALRYSSFQVVSVMTTTGYGTDDFNQWNSFSRGILFLLMFVGGCAGSTGGGMKVIRHILFLKIMRLEIERAYHPTVVRPLRLGGNAVEDPDLRRNILVYFGLILVIFVFSWMAVVTIEPDETWTATEAGRMEDKLIDSATGVAATLNNIGPGLGTIGPTSTYEHFTWPTKLLFTWLMMLGRLEIFVILVLFMPSFWRTR
jgi:trk system potassium uptake protein TrkH